MRISGGGLEDDRGSNYSILNLSFSGKIAFIESAHKPHVKEHPRIIYALFDFNSFLQRQSQGFFTKDRFAMLGSRQDDIPVGAG